MEDKFIGKRLDGRYEIHQLIGTGGMSNVYKAYDNKEDRWVAVKILKDEFSNNTEFLRRFRNESKAIAMLSHPNIVKVFDVSFGDVIQYIVMEYISGITIKEYITRRGVLSWKEAMYFTIQILKALSHAHDRGIIHRDIKPQNIILLKDGLIKVTDFGIARVSQNQTQTVSDKALGSVHYISPEQARGDFTTHKADIYSLGVTLYEMVTGALPFDGESVVSVALMQVQNTAENPRKLNPSIPQGLEEIIMKAMEKNPAMRFSGAIEMLADIEKVRVDQDMMFNYKQDLAATKQVDTTVIRERVEDKTRVVSDIPRSTPQQVRTTNKNYNDSFDYEEELVKSKRTAKGSMVITGIVSAVIVLLLAFGVYLVVDYMAEEPEEIVDEVLVPLFVGLDYEQEVNGNLQYEDFTFRVQYVEDETKAVGEIIKQTPNDGIMVKIGKEVTLQVVKEPDVPPQVPVPNVVGESEVEAHNILQAEGFVVRVENVNNEYTPFGNVISSNPEADFMVTPGSEITLYISKGPAEIPVPIPGLIGETLENAEAALESVGLRLGNVSYDEESKEDAGIVVKSSPNAGDKVSEGSAVDIVVSKGNYQAKVVNAVIPLPQGATGDAEVKVYLGGALYGNPVTLNLELVSTHMISLVGKAGTLQVAVYLNDEEYMFGEVEFDSDSGSFSMGDFYPYTSADGTVIYP